MMTAPVNTRSGYIDSWRFLAISLVILGHFFQVRHAIAPVNPGLGVLIFFFISGFVVSKASLSELAKTGGFSRAAFYARRTLRIIPPLMIYLLTCYAFGLLGLIDFDARQLLSGASYICNTTLSDCGWYAGHTWSLAFEEQFYLLFPLVFVWIEMSRRPNVWLLIVFAVMASLPLWFTLHWVGRSGFVLIYGLFTMGYLFAKHERTWLEVPHAGMLFTVGLTLTFLPIGLFDDPLIGKYYKFVYLISIPLMIVASGSASFSLKRAFECRVTRYIGRISYSIYLWQQLFTDSFKTFPLALNLVALVAMVLACALLFTYVETPLIRQGRRLSDRLQSRRLRGSSFSVA